jgi:hypothetical protein
LRVNAAEAAENRENHHASTDELDLLGIAKTLLSRRATDTARAFAAKSVPSSTGADVYREFRSQATYIDS